MMTFLSELVQWRKVPVGASAAVGEIQLSIGEIGSGGPVALITAGIHGDEGPWGARAIHKMLAQVPQDQLRGTIRIIPVANPLAMEADARNAPLDSLDLNRVFPGNPAGSHTEKLAAAIVNNALDNVKLVIDLHGGGSWCVNAFSFVMPGGEEYSKAFRAPFLVKAPDRDVTLTGFARTKGAIVAAVEMGGRSEFEDHWADKIAAGLRRALSLAGVLSADIEGDEDNGDHSVPVRPSTVLRPSQGGIFVPEVGAEHVGKIVEQDTVLGYLLEPSTQQVLETFRAPFPRTAMMLLRPRIAVLEGGAMTYVVTEPEV
jgi:predicted deacylase